MSEKATLTLAELEANLRAALEVYAKCKAAEDCVRREATDATNRVNRAQKALDDAVAKLRAEAPWSTDWRSQRQPNYPA